MASANGNGTKSASKLAPVIGRPFPKGARVPGQGRGPKKGAPNAGRPPDKFRDFCRELLATKDADAAVKAILNDESHPAYAAMWKAVSDRGYGKPTQAVEVSGNINVNVQDARERIARRIDRLALTN